MSNTERQAKTKMSTTENTKVTAILDAYQNGATWVGTDNDWHAGEDEYLWPRDKDAIAARIGEADACYVETEDGARHLVRP
jgi:hypothetical protein